MAKKTNKKSGTLDRYMYTKTWVKLQHRTLDQEQIEWRIYNDLPLDDLIDENVNKYKKKDDKNRF